MIRGARRFTLFPYTTLFRSDGKGERPNHSGLAVVRNPSDRAPILGVSVLAIGLFLHFVRKLVDRKSTRLNSSHERISYAVFCFEKKTPHRARRSCPQHSPRS